MAGLLFQTVVCMDDILISGRTMKEHDERLKRVMDTIRVSGLKLNKEKSKLLQPKLEFLGQMISKDGITINPERIQTIDKVEPPTNLTELKRLGMVNYIDRCLPNLSIVLQQLNELQKLDRHSTTSRSSSLQLQC